MKVGYLSLGDFFPNQWKLLEEGHHLNLYFNCDSALSDSTGMSSLYGDRLHNYNGRLEQMVIDSDFVYCDYWEPEGLVSKLREYCSKHNTPWVGANTSSSVQLERSRDTAKLLAGKLGLAKTRVTRYTSKDDCIKSLSPDKSVVFKAVNQVDALTSTYIPLCYEDSVAFVKDDMLNMFSSGGVIVEPKHEGTEICIGGHFNGKTFGELILVNQEYKFALPNKEGAVLTGEVGTVAKWYSRDELGDRLLPLVERVEAYLSNMEDGYQGYFDMNLMVTSKAVHLLEFTCRQGMPTEALLCELVDDYGALLAWVAGIGEFSAIGHRSGYFVSGILTTFGLSSFCPSPADYSFTPHINGLSNLKHPYVNMSAKCRDGHLYANPNGRHLLIYGRGDTLTSAMEEYALEATKISCWGSYIRRDIGCDWIEPTKVNSRLGKLNVKS